ncbi:MAG: tRNA pseudouridine(13) synthase TruD [Planctomycetes bacterium]|nr:tRNA pseudouridine(13) synthase TruD [Planctomycetota bacterium]
MKVKQTPNDFIVREVSDYTPVKDGLHSVYRLSKTSVGTLEAINLILQLWNIRRPLLSTGALKDRHAQTEQLISICRGPMKDLQHHSIGLKYLGQSDQPIRPDSLSANHFTIVLRDLSKSDTEKIQERIKEINQYGVSNYFDEQRFGSVRGGNEFPAKQLIKRDYEGALKTALTATSKEDRSLVRKTRQAIAENWGDWKKCFESLDRSSERSIINYLVMHPFNFRQAFELMNPNLVLLFLHSYQSFIWNKGLNRLLLKHLEASQKKNRDIVKMPYLLGEFIFYQSLNDDTLKILKELSIPFMTHKTIFPDETISAVFSEILKEEGIAQNDFRTRGMEKTYFRRGERKAIIFPETLSIKGVENDELAKGKRLKVTMELQLPRGAYATIIIKRLSYDFK